MMTEQQPSLQQIFAMCVMAKMMQLVKNPPDVASVTHSCSAHFNVEVPGLEKDCEACKPYKSRAHHRGCKCAMRCAPRESFFGDEA